MKCRKKQRQKQTSQLRATALNVNNVTDDARDDILPETKEKKLKINEREKIKQKKEF